MERSDLVCTELAEYPPDTLLSQRALASVLGVSPRTIRRMICRYELPPGIKLGGRKVWIVRALREFLEQRFTTAAEAAAETRARVPRLRNSRSNRFG